MKGIVNYLKDVLYSILGILGLFLCFIILLVVCTWDISFFEGDRFLNESTYVFFRLVIVLSFIIGLFMRVKLSINFK